MQDVKQEFLQALEAERNPEKTHILSGFFKTGKSQYGEGDIFWGITVPIQRRISRLFYQKLTAEDFKDLLTNPIHEIRLCTLIMMVQRFQKAKDDTEKAVIVDIYISHMDFVNNWDLVDLSAPYITGPWFFKRSQEPLIGMANSGHLWKQRIAMLTTYYFIRQRQYDTALSIATILMPHKHDLIHKAVGWMLREIGNRDYHAEYDFLLIHYKTMPRTMLRYAIEKFDEPVRQGFLKGMV